MRYLFFLIILTLSYSFYSCKDKPVNKPTKIAFVGAAQGTYYSIIYFATDTVVFQSEIDSLLDDFDLSASLWKENSTLSRVNNGEDSVSDKTFIKNFRLSEKVNKESNGYFDITVGSLVNAWGFGFKTGKKPDSIQIDSLLNFIGMEKIKLINGKIEKLDGVKIDFNAIAQGLSVDYIGEFFRSKNINSYIIDVGGEVLTGDKKPDSSLWYVGIEKPKTLENGNDNSREIEEIIAVEKCAVATSGSYRKFYIKNGVRFSHTINPTTGFPVTHSLLSATVITKTAALADAYATAFMVMGVEKTKDFLKKRDDIEAFLIFETKDKELITWQTKGFSKLVD